MTPETGNGVPAVLKAWKTTRPEARGDRAQMGENLTGFYAAAACLAALCLSGTALAQAPLPSPPRDTGTRGANGNGGARGAIGAPGVVIRYEESASAGIVYHEEKGGMVSTIPPPVKPAAPAKSPAKAPADAPAKAPAVAEVAPTKTAATRR